MGGEGNVRVRLGQLLTAQSHGTQELGGGESGMVELGHDPSCPDGVDEERRRRSRGVRPSHQLTWQGRTNKPS
jgi:hypothetical protein